MLLRSTTGGMPGYGRAAYQCGNRIVKTAAAAATAASAARTTSVLPDPRRFPGMFNFPRSGLCGPVSDINGRQVATFLSGTGFAGLWRAGGRYKLRLYGFSGITRKGMSWARISCGLERAQRRLAQWRFTS